MTAKDLIQQLQLQPHPEGGYYKETYRSDATMMVHESDHRNVSTAIYFLLQERQVSAFHRIKSDELWFFHQGEPLEIVYIQEGRLYKILLGNHLTAGEVPQAMIPANTWFASRIKSGTGFSLVSCTVAPGFDFRDFEMGEREQLIQQHPSLRHEIKEFTHG